MEAGQPLVPVLLALISVLLGAVFALIAWIGNRIFGRMDNMQKIMRESETMLHTRITNHETRIAHIEAGNFHSPHRAREKT